MPESLSTLSTTPKKFASQIKKTLLDIFFPIECFHCQAPDQLLCKSCLKKILVKTEQTCPHCETIITPQGKICPKCKIKFAQSNSLRYLDFLVSSSEYKQCDLNKLIHFYKYRFIKDLCFPFGEIMIQTLIGNDISIPDLIIPVPLHKKRLRQRGFNQSELLARQISQHLAPGFPIPMENNILFRKNNTSAQMKIKNFESRQINIQGAFRVINCQKIKNKNLLLVDDVATTGSTLFECAKMLRENDAKTIGAIVLARQSFIH